MVDFVHMPPFPARRSTRRATAPRNARETAACERNRPSINGREFALRVPNDCNLDGVDCCRRHPSRACSCLGSNAIPRRANGEKCARAHPAATRAPRHRAQHSRSPQDLTSRLERRVERLLERRVIQRDRTVVFPDDPPLLVDQYARRDDRCLKDVRDLSVGIDGDHVRHLLVFHELLHGVGTAVVEAHADDPQSAGRILLVHLLELGNLEAARPAPRCPEVQQNDVSLLRREIELFPVEGLRLIRRHHRADVRLGNLVRFLLRRGALVHHALDDRRLALSARESEHRSNHHHESFDHHGHCKNKSPAKRGAWYTGSSRWMYRLKPVLHFYSFSSSTFPFLMTSGSAGTAATPSAATGSASAFMWVTPTTTRSGSSSTLTPAGSSRSDTRL